MTLITIGAIFLFIDWFYVLWIVGLSYKLPSYISAGFIMSMFGVVEGIHQKLGAFINQNKSIYGNKMENQI